MSALHAEMAARRAKACGESAALDTSVRSGTVIR
jgi:hypothetical protein